jgi:hypothetical protein
MSVQRGLQTSRADCPRSGTDRQIAHAARAQLKHPLSPTCLRPPQIQGDLHPSHGLHRDRDPFHRQLLRRQRRAESRVFAAQKCHNRRPARVIQTPVRRPAALTRHETRVTLPPPRPNQAFELANTNPKPLRRRPLTLMPIQKRPHQMRTLHLSSTHLQTSPGRLPPAWPHGQKGAF